MGSFLSVAEQLDRRRFLLVISALMLVLFLGALDQTIVATALPTIVGDLGGIEYLSWTITAYMLAMTAAAPLYGKLGDLYGRKWVMQGSVGIFLAGSILSGGLFGLSTMTASTSTATAMLWMFVVGFGMGVMIQVLVLIVQNAAPYKDLGAATSLPTLFRSVGGSVGTAALGSIFTSTLTSHLDSSLPPAYADKATSSGFDPTAVAQLPAKLREPFLEAFTQSLDKVFLCAAIAICVAFAIAFFIQAIKMRTTIES